MATAHSVTFQADKDSLFATTIQIVNGSGYIISETNDAARKIIYYADSPRIGFQDGYRFEVTITVSGVSQGTDMTSLISIKAIVAERILLFQKVYCDKFECELINFIIKELKRRYQIISRTTTTNAPGAGGKKAGCLVAMGLLGTLAIGLASGLYYIFA